MMKPGQTSEDTSIMGARDAVHIAGELVVCTDTLAGGDSVRWVSCGLVVKCERGKRHGVVDPFLEYVNPGTLFWMFFDPARVSNLRHDFDVVETPAEHAEWCKASCDPEEMEVVEEEDWCKTDCEH